MVVFLDSEQTRAYVYVIAFSTWIAFFSGMLLYAAISCIRLKQRVRELEAMHGPAQSLRDEPAQRIGTTASVPIPIEVEHDIELMGKTEQAHA